MCHSPPTSPASQDQGQVHAQCQFYCLSFVPFCKPSNARLLCSLQFRLCKFEVNCFPAASIRNVVEKVSALTKLPVGIRIVAKDLTDSEQEKILELMEGGKALLRSDKPQGSSKWVCTCVADPKLHHEVILPELASHHFALERHPRVSQIIHTLVSKFLSTLNRVWAGAEIYLMRFSVHLNV